MNTRMLAVLLLLLATAFACDARVDNIVIGREYNCPNGVPPEQARIYAGEGFYVCGEAYLNGELLLAGTITGSEERVMDDHTAITNGRFSLYGTANVKQHKYYYIVPALEKPCEKDFGPVPVEIKTDCVFVPPSTIEAVPNVVEQGDSFTLEVKNSPANMQMEITGIANPVKALIPKGGGWSQSLPASECSTLGSCVVNFEFTDSEHELCTASTSIVVTVKQSAEATAEPQENDGLLIATFLVLLLGTGGAVLLNRYL